jgi:hypothetical protein
MARKPETLLQLRIQQEIRKRWPGCYVRKIHGNEFQHSGIPDLICCIEGLFIAIEVKRPGVSVSKMQQNEAVEISHAGGLWILGESIGRVIRDIADVLEKQTRPSAAQMP